MRGRKWSWPCNRGHNITGLEECLTDVLFETEQLYELPGRICKDFIRIWFADQLWSEYACRNWISKLQLCEDDCNLFFPSALEQDCVAAVTNFRCGHILAVSMSACCLGILFSLPVFDGLGCAHHLLRVMLIFAGQIVTHWRLHVMVWWCLSSIHPDVKLQPRFVAVPWNLNKFDQLLQPPGNYCCNMWCLLDRGLLTRFHLPPCKVLPNPWGLMYIYFDISIKLVFKWPQKDLFAAGLQETVTFLASSSVLQSMYLHALQLDFHLMILSKLCVSLTFYSFPFVRPRSACSFRWAVETLQKQRAAVHVWGAWQRKQLSRKPLRRWECWAPALQHFVREGMRQYGRKWLI